MKIQLRVIDPYGGEEKIIDLCDGEEQMKKITVLDLKRKITEEFTVKEDVRLVFGAEPLEESSLLTSYGIRHMSTIHTVILLPGGGGPGTGVGGMGDKEGKNRSMERVFLL